MIAICTPTRDTVNAGFAYDLISLLRRTSEAIWTVSQGTLLCNLRGLLVKTALSNGASHILFIDSDMRFPDDTLNQLLLRDKDIIAANCKQRTQNEWTARKDETFISSQNKTGVEIVDTVGMGVTLITRKVFETIPEPWFATPWDGTKHVGEDIYFCEMARRAGFTINIDHDLSQQVRHAGLVEFGI